MKSPIARFKRIQEFLTEEEVVRQSQSQLPWGKRVLHFWILVFRSFQKNRGPVRAAALAYTTLLSLIPVLAVIVSISTAFLQTEASGQKSGKKTTVDRLLDRFVDTVAPQLNLKVQDDEEAAINRATVVQKINDYITAINSGALGLTAGIALVFIAIMVLSTVEATFNDIWGVRRGRTWSSRIIQYWAAITLGTIFLLTAFALTTGSQMETMTRWIERTPYVGTIVFSFILPCIVLGIFLTLFYKLMPATRVRWDAALIGGLTGGFLLQLNSLSSAVYYSRVATYSKIYGGLGAVPIFLLGMYISWLIVLLGAQVAYAYQNKRAYLQEKQAETINQRGKEFVALRLMTYIGAQFYAGNKPPTRLDMASHLGVPSQLACNVLLLLVNAKLLVEVQGEETGYAPGRPIDRISVEDILCALRVGQGTELATADDASRVIIRQEYERVLDAEKSAAAAVTLQDLVLRLADTAKQQPAEIPAKPAPLLQTA